MQTQICWLINWAPFLNIKSRHILETSIAHGRLKGLLGDSPLSPILCLCSQVQTFILELKPKECELCSDSLRHPSANVREGTASRADCHRNINAFYHHCLLSTQVQRKNPWADQTPWLFLQGWM